MSNGTLSQPFDRDRPPSPVLDDTIESALPRVARSADRLTLPVIVLSGVALGLLVLFLLSEQRLSLQQSRIAPPPFK